MSKIPMSRGSPQGLPHSGPRGRGFFPRGDGDGDKSPPMADSGTGARITLFAPRGPRTYEKTMLSLIDIYYIYTYLYFYVISPIFI